MTWIATATKLPPDGVVVDTMVADDNGVRIEPPLKRVGRLWFVEDGSVYVYYTPTHWQERKP